MKKDRVGIPVLKGCHHYYTLVEINASLCIYYQALRANSEKRLIYVPDVKRFFQVVISYTTFPQSGMFLKQRQTISQSHPSSPSSIPTGSSSP